MIMRIGRLVLENFEARSMTITPTREKFQHTLFAPNIDRHKELIKVP